jgi:hypothetical protein
MKNPSESRRNSGHALSQPFTGGVALLLIGVGALISARRPCPAESGVA